MPCKEGKIVLPGIRTVVKPKSYDVTIEHQINGTENEVHKQIPLCKRNQAMKKVGFGGRMDYSINNFKPSI